MSTSANVLPSRNRAFGLDLPRVAPSRQIKRELVAGNYL